MEDIVVKLQSGLVRGVVEKHVEDFNYYAFRGIPYAEPPVGELRFEDPVPKEKWDGIMDCTNFRPMCLQQDLVFGESSYNEDCLHLNVFTRRIGTSNVKRAVILVIHGGLFLCGSGDDSVHGPEYLIRKDIVMVTVNYRLGVLGFLSLEDEIAPGNQGLKDILLALHWIQQNIQVFGGDPDNVTVLGLGTSGAVSHLLALSPLARGLIHKAISQSCVLYNPWLSITNPKSNAIQLCSLLGKQLTDSKEILKFLKSVNAKSLQEAQENLRLSLDESPFGMAIDSKSSSPFLPSHRYVFAKQGVEIPYLTGYAAQEGIIILNGISRKSFLQMSNENFRNIFNLNSHEVMERYNLTEQQIRQLYYGNEEVSESNLDKFVTFASDIYFIEGIHKVVRVQAEHNSTATYLYQFSYVPQISIVKLIIEDAPDGSGHFSELHYLFKMRALESLGIGYYEKGTKEYKLMDRMTEMFTNFAKYGKPTVDVTELIPEHWRPVEDGTNICYMNIDDEIKMECTVNVDQKLLSARNIKI